ncbi:MAG: 3,4-dihydroxy-2-butanone-4-phosphate synthase [Flavobacteriaceae bacterium]|nr:3,4-dihydroxy-2-butanone-4-phosphate synthase [Flavobacteriaceae bacterium]
MAFDKIPDAIEAIKRGKVIVVVDDADRENEGDFVAAAEMVTPELINFMATHGRGLICVPLSQDRCQQLRLAKMASNNTDPMQTAFTVSVDLKGYGVTTGISAEDRSKTIKALVDPKSSPEDFVFPGHVFPLMAKPGGVLRRTGHTEAAIDFASLAGMQPAGVIVEIMNPDGTMARVPELKKIAEKHNIRIVSIEDLVSYRMQHDRLISKKLDASIQTIYGEFRLRVYKQTTNEVIHFALTRGEWTKRETIATRIESSRVSNDIINKIIKGGKSKLASIFNVVNTQEKGAILFINKEQDSENLLARFIELERFQSSGDLLRVPPISMDDRDYGIGAQILDDIGISRILLISNSEQKQRVGITGYGLEITGYIRY